MNWGLYIKKLREERDITQGELSRRSGVSRGHLSRIEIGSYKSCNHETFEKLAKGLGLSPSELSYIIQGKEPIIPRETPGDLIRRALISFPDTVPIYDPEEFALRLHGPVEPSDFVYRRKYPQYKNVVGCYAYGKCLEPEIHDGDILIVDDNTRPEVGDIAVCLIDERLHTGKITLIDGIPWLINNNCQIELSQCERSWLIIEVRRRLK